VKRLKFTADLVFAFAVKLVYLHAEGANFMLQQSPSKKSMQRFKTKIGETLVPANVAPWEDVRDQLNSMLLG
jgi:hypothetical protein